MTYTLKSEGKMAPCKCGHAQFVHAQKGAAHCNAWTCKRDGKCKRFEKA